MAEKNLGRVVGMSAYEIWKKQSGNGNKTETEFLVSLKGEKGERGERGERGLQGEKGVQGEKGAQGEKGVQGEKGSDGVVGSFSINSDGFLIYTT